MGRVHFPWIDIYVGLLTGHEAIETLWYAAIGGMSMKINAKHGHDCPSKLLATSPRKKHAHPVPNGRCHTPT